MSDARRSIDVHPTAQVDPSAVLEEGVRIGPGAFVGPHCRVGARTELMKGATLVAHTSLGSDNVVHPYAVLGGDPQDRAYSVEAPGGLVVGDRNIIREHVTISRSTTPKGADPATVAPTTVGSGCFLMASAHIGHNGRVGDGVVMTNGATLAGWVTLGDGVVMSAFAVCHQFCRVGELVMFQGYAGISMHVPPYVLLTQQNLACGLNRVGLRRSGRLTPEDIREIRSAFTVMYRTSRGRPIADRIAECDSMGLGAAASRFVDVFRRSLEDKPPFRRGVVGFTRGRASLRAGAGLAEAEA